MAGAAEATVDHDRIRDWVEARHGHPARVKDTGDGDDVGLLRIDFPGYSGEESLEEISWSEFFSKFEAKNLAFLYQNSIDDDTSRFFKLVDRDSVEYEEC